MAKQGILTTLMIEKAKPRPGKRYDLLDGPHGLPGFTCRVSERGVKTFALRYWLKGTQRRLTLGRWPVLTLAAARAAARAALETAATGVDPATAKVEAKRERERDSVEAIVGRYVERYLKKETRRWHDAERMFARDVLPIWGGRPIQGIDRRDVLDLVDGISDRGSPVAANRTLSLIKRFLNWAVEDGYVEANVAAGIKARHKETPRERILSETEIRAAWQAFDQLGYPFGVLGQLLLLTGQRRGEMAGLRWDDLDLEAGALHLAGAATKTGVAHVVPLPRAAVALLQGLPRIDGSLLVFPANRVGSVNPIGGFSKALASAHRLSGTTGWHWHDLRRTCASHMARLGVAPHVVEKILNHNAGSTMSVIARTYNRYNYQAEQRQALELWAAELDRIVTGGPAKVVAIGARSR